MKKGRERRRCEYCGKKYATKRYWQKYCSENCSMYGWWRNKILKKVAIVLLVLGMTSSAFAWTNTEIVNAIYLAEGGGDAQYLYGIRSVKYDSPEEARQICLNTIRNQRVRHEAHVCNLSFIECLAKRYCPVGASNDPKGLNQYWLKNVTYFLERGGK